MNLAGQRTETAHKILLVLVLVTFMGAGGLAGEGGKTQSSAGLTSTQAHSDRASVQTTTGAPSVPPATGGAGSKQATHPYDCLEERSLSLAGHTPAPSKMRHLMGLIIEE